jgi:hypothetical protein
MSIFTLFSRIVNEKPAVLLKTTPYI